MIGGSQKPISIILADDQAEVRNALRRYLDRDGRFTIIAEAENGNQAVGRAELLKPEALILDLAMPDLDGLEALPRLRKASPNTTIIVLSSMVKFGASGDQALSLGASAVYDKYVSPEVIIEFIVKTRSELGDNDRSGGGFQSDDLEDIDSPTPT